MNRLVSLALGIAARFSAADITAIEAEEALLALGFYNIRFNSKEILSAQYLGVTYPLAA